jgi:hypothetical protein
MLATALAAALAGCGIQSQSGDGPTWSLNGPDANASADSVAVSKSEAYGTLR